MPDTRLIERWLPIAELGIDSARGRATGEGILEPQLWEASPKASRPVSG